VANVTEAFGCRLCHLSSVSCPQTLARLREGGPKGSLQLDEEGVGSPLTAGGPLKRGAESAACPEARDGPRQGQKPPDPNSSVGSAAAWTPRGELMWDRNWGCQGRVAQGFICSGSLSAGTQLELFYTTVALSKFIWCMSCRGLYFGEPRAEPER